VRVQKEREQSKRSPPAPTCHVNLEDFKSSVHYFPKQRFCRYRC